MLLKSMLCNVCNHNAVPFEKARILGKYDVQYFKCRNCGFIQTEEPYWLEDAYCDSINRSDIGLVDRNITLSKISRAIIIMFFDSDKTFLDYGGGYGLFVRMMRDAGLDFYHYDKFCQNLFAKTFDAEMEETNQYELVTAFEVFEHFVDPINEIEQILQFSSSILFSTRLVPSSNPKPREWWYYELDHGQHVALYTRESLEIIAERFHLNLLSNGRSLHLLTEKRILPFMFHPVLRYKIAVLLNLFLSKKSLLADDYFKVTGRPLS